MAKWSPAPLRGGVSAAQSASAAVQRSAKAQPGGRSPGGGTVPAIAGSAAPGALAAGIVRKSAAV
jgi:hypothetical protein